MATKRLVTNSEQELKNVMEDVKDWFKNTKDFDVKFSTEKRKFLDPDIKQIVEKDIDVINIKDSNDKTSTIKFIPLIEKSEMKIEITGSNENVLAAKISNQIKGRGKLKGYTKDAKVPMKEHIIKKSELKQIIREEIKKIYEK